MYRSQKYALFIPVLIFGKRNDNIYGKSAMFNILWANAKKLPFTQKSHYGLCTEVAREVYKYHTICTVCQLWGVLQNSWVVYFLYFPSMPCFLDERISK